MKLRVVSSMQEDTVQSISKPKFTQIFRTHPSHVWYHWETGKDNCTTVNVRWNQN